MSLFSLIYLELDYMFCGPQTASVQLYVTCPNALFYFKFIFICSTFKSLEQYIISLHFAVKEWECFWAVILRAFESSFKDFLWTFLLFHSFSLQSLYLTIFQKIVICLLSHITVTYEWFKHKKAPNSKNEPMLCLYIKLIQFDRHKRVFLHQHGDSQKGILLGPWLQQPSKWKCSSDFSWWEISFASAAFTLLLNEQ